MNLAQLRARLKELAGEIDVLTKKDTISAEDLTQIDAKTKELEEVEKNIEILQRADAARVRSAAPADAHITERTTVPAAVTQKMTTAEKIGTMVFCMAKTYKDDGARGAKATFKAMEEVGYGEVAKEFAGAQARALNSGSASAGGVLLPEEMSSEIIDILRPSTTFLRGGPRRISLAAGAYKLSAAASGATANWRGEGEAIETSQPTFKDINLTAKFLDAMVPLTNQLIRWSLADVRQWVERDMSLEMGTKLDYAAYFGSGTAHMPLGITKIPGVFSVAAQGGLTPTIAQIETAARAAELAMEGKNLPMMSTAWVMAPRSRTYLADLRDGNGNRYFPELQGDNPRWRGRPVLSTTQVSIVGGGTTDESSIMLVNFDDVLYGEGAGISFGVSTEATYVKNGVTVSAFQNDLTLIKASLEADVDMRYLEAVSVISGVRWGA
ncbi:phage major capsid protein [Rhizobium azibense]|uniref:HK97 family phage major capsid protein n=1 Tax=Rhizobium azibense TaxID=1136135 RepID=A0A4V2VDV4_9HYPH|nr:phage major capsid protein [Rhizobium azibense]TCU34155.1 HK97 family phage major capsid protein [Rhizobium azibense]